MIIYVMNNDNFAVGSITPDTAYGIFCCHIQLLSMSRLCIYVQAALHIQIERGVQIDQ